MRTLGKLKSIFVLLMIMLSLGLTQQRSLPVGDAPTAPQVDDGDDGGQEEEEEEEEDEGGW